MVNLTIDIKTKCPKVRIKMALLFIWAVGPFIRSEKTARKIESALLSWVSNGFRIYQNGNRI